MEAMHRERRARLLGVSNVSREQLLRLCRSPCRPRLVQNRCYARTGWDRRGAGVLSREREMVYRASRC